MLQCDEIFQGLKDQFKGAPLKSADQHVLFVLFRDTAKYKTQNNIYTYMDMSSDAIEIVLTDCLNSCIPKMDHMSLHAFDILMTIKLLRVINTERNNCVLAHSQIQKIYNKNVLCVIFLGIKAFAFQKNNV